MNHWNDEPMNVWDIGQEERGGQENQSLEHYQKIVLDRESWMIPKLIHSEEP